MDFVAMAMLFHAMLGSAAARQGKLESLSEF